MCQPTLSDIEAEVARQSAAFEAMKTALSSFDDVELHVPNSFFDELEEATQGIAGGFPMNGVRA